MKATTESRTIDRGDAEADKIHRPANDILENLRMLAKEATRTSDCLGSIAEGVCTLTAPVRVLVRDSETSHDYRGFDFPLSNTGLQTVDALKAFCHPASFGRGTENVFDATYRNALAIEKTCFMTDLLARPDCDIADRVRSVVFTPDDIENNHQVTFEPVKFNIYGEGGFFKKHRDTPYSSSHFGSLVVCLPNAF
jgi:hypothetical protein